MNDAVGWISTLILLATLMTQMREQWRQGTATGVSPWLFAGQCAASVGFLTYSILVKSPVFIASNTMILLMALAGQVLTSYLKRHPRPKAATGQ